MIKRILITVLIIITLISLDVAGVHYYSKYLVGFEKTYVASHNIFQRTVISEEDLMEIEIPKGYLSGDVLNDKNEIIGKLVKLSYSIPKGSFFYKSSVEDTGKDIDHTLLMNRQVTYDIYTSEAKVNTGSLSRNMYVDLYLTVVDNHKPVSDLILSDARIIGMYDMNEQPIQDFDRNSRAYIISLAVDENDVNYLNKAFVVGEVKVIVSNDTYKTGKRSALNYESEIFEYLR